MTDAGVPRRRDHTLTNLQFVFGEPRTNVYKRGGAVHSTPHVRLLAKITDDGFRHAEASKAFGRCEARRQRPNVGTLLRQVPDRRSSNLSRTTDHRDHGRAYLTCN